MTALLNDPAVGRWLLWVPYPYRLSDARRFIDRSMREYRAGRTLNLAIIERLAGRLVGAISLREVSREHRRAELGYWIGRPFWKNGYGTEAAREVMRFAFETLRLERLEAAVFRGNRRSDRLLAKLGFRKEGTRPHSFWVHGRWVDDVLYGLRRQG